MPWHKADLGTDNAEQDVALHLLKNTEQILAEVADALRRLEAGEYGHCQECGQEISRERLEAVPWTRHCVSCARQVQGEGGSAAPGS
jgi:RNA polymerase-binding transcription factor DksA